jgi:hypothetical protein
VQVPTNTLSIFAPASDITAAKVKVNNSTITDVAFLLNSVNRSKNIGTSKIVTTMLMAMICAAIEIFCGENE